MRRFKFKKRRNKKLKYCFFILILFISLKTYISSIKKIKYNSYTIGTILNYSNFNKQNIISNIYNKIHKVLFNDPSFMLNRELSKTESIDSIKLLYNENKVDSINDNYDIYIYNSHQKEAYSNKYLEDYNIIPTVQTAAYMLEEKLGKYNINVLVEENDISKYLEDNNLDYSGSYVASRFYLKKCMEKYSDIRLFIDLHRDAATHDATYVNIDGKDYAKVLFVIGLGYDTYYQNLEIVSSINDILNNKYPNLSRGIMKKKGVGVNGVYNQDLASNIILLEVGGNENNIEEVNNTLDAVSEAIKEYLNEEKK